MVDVPPAAASRREAQRREYGQFVATQNIRVNGALAFTRGQAVPASNVAAHDYETAGLVRRREVDVQEPAVEAVEPVDAEVKDQEPTAEAGTGSKRRS